MVKILEALRSSLQRSRRLSVDFDEEQYLLANRDARAAVSKGLYASGADHYSQVGRQEKRPLRLPVHSPVEAPKVLTDEQLQHWDQRGFLVLPGFFSKEQTTAYNAHIDNLWDTRQNPENPLVIDAPGGRQYFRDTPSETRFQGSRLNDLYLSDRMTLDFAMDPRLNAILYQLLQHAPVICNSLFFELGSQQRLHYDTYFMPPETPNQMLATWIAFDDVDDDNGPLIYVPGSHKLPPYFFSNGWFHAAPGELDLAYEYADAQIKGADLKPERFHAKEGDVLIWHAQLFHGGDAIRDINRRRRSLVSHYYSKPDRERFKDYSAAENGSLIQIKNHLPVGPSSE